MANPKHETIARAMTDRLFEDMQNPNYRGSKFTWEIFPDMATGRVETELFLYYARQPKNFEEIKTQAMNYTTEYAHKLMLENPEKLHIPQVRKPSI